VGFIKKLKYFLLPYAFRRVADGIYEKFPFFYMEKSEFICRCLQLQSCGAGLALGYAREGFDVRIVAVPDGQSPIAANIYENLPTGYFGEIIFKDKSAEEFAHTSLYGFFDQRGRIWCCGSIKDTVLIDGKKYFPHCIEPLFERLWWVKRAKLLHTNGTKDNGLRIELTAIKIFSPFIRLFWKYFLGHVEKFSKKFKILERVEEISLVRRRLKF
jgi:hypothetical protein